MLLKRREIDTAKASLLQVTMVELPCKIVLMLIAFIPVTAHLPVKNDWNRFFQALVLVIYTAVPAAIAVLITWQMTQTVEPSLY